MEKDNYTMIAFALCDKLHIAAPSVERFIFQVNKVAVHLKLVKYQTVKEYTSL